MGAKTGSGPLLFDRLRTALLPEYTLVREIARGGMGVVYLGHDIALDRPVAIKLLMPELATADLAARFLREARVLARLRHANIVTIHHVCEKNGLFYYIMDYLEGETLQSRLSRGVLSPGEVVRVGAELLDAVGTAHGQQWVHRDIKPGNIFLTNGQAVLTDFGIARPLVDESTALTEPMQLIGTFAYMSPEQREGRHATEASDIYSAGIVLYEAISGRRWWDREGDTEADWTGVPLRIRRVLRKAVRPDPRERWQSAHDFRRALVQAQGFSMVIPVSALGVLALGAGLYLGITRQPDQVAPGHRIALEALTSSGVAEWGDSVGRAVVASLAAFPDLLVSGPHESGAEDLRSSTLVLTGSVNQQDDSLRITIQSRGGSARPIRITAAGVVGGWRAVVDSAASQVLYALYVSDAERDPYLPRGALPRTLSGWREWSRAEPLFTQARWGEAALAYQLAERVDPTCLICAFRLNDIDRWLDRPHDAGRLARLQAHAHEFPPHYRFLIQAANARWPDRLSLMDSATQARNFYLAFFHKGDEIFHRGPLFGHRRSEALEELETAVALRPDFAPAWEHLTWLRIAEDDEAGARHALDNFERARPVQDQISMGVQFLLNAAFAYRFLPAGTGDGMVQQALLIPEMDDFPNLAMAPRLMLTFDAPTGSVGMGKLFAGRNTVADVRSGLLAQVLGYLAQGLPDSALRYAERLKARVPRQEIFAAQLEGTLALVDGDSTNASTAARERARDELRRYILPSAGTEEARARAAWLLALLSRRAGDGPTAHRATQVIRDGSLELREYYLALLQADSLASSAQYQQALGLTDWDGDALVRLSDPFLSTVIHLFRADWFLADGNPQAALRTLVWHEAYDFATYPVGDPQAPEIDQAFSTLSRWKQARLMDLNQSSTAEACRAYRAVTRHWKQGSPRSRERADIAEQRLATLPCSS